ERLHVERNPRLALRQHAREDGRAHVDGPAVHHLVERSLHRPAGDGERRPPEPRLLLEIAGACEPDRLRAGDDVAAEAHVLAPRGGRLVGRLRDRVEPAGTPAGAEDERRGGRRRRRRKEEAPHQYFRSVGSYFVTRTSPYESCGS